MKKWNQLSQFRQTSTHQSRVLNWLYFQDEPRAQERQQVKDHQSYTVHIRFQVAQLGHGNMFQTISYMVDW